MRRGWGPRRRFRRAAAALLAFALVPVTALAASALAAVPVSSHVGIAWSTDGPALRIQDGSLPATEALQRSQGSNLFAPFRWDGLMVAGAFVQFAYNQWTGELVGYSSMNRSTPSLIVESMQTEDFAPTSTPLIAGPSFVAAGNALLVISHDEPMGLLEVRTLGHPRTLVLHLSTASTDLELSGSGGWPHATLGFTYGGGRGEIILGAGNLTLQGTTVTASMTSQDYFALKALPASADHQQERGAILSAFGSGRLVAEYNLVAVTNGGWLENSAEFLPGVGSSSTGVRFGQATVNISVGRPTSGLVLLAFDPQTMPVDATHALQVSVGGKAISESSDPLGLLYGLSGSPQASSFVRLPMNATVLAVYLPDVGTASLQVNSVAHTVPGMDLATEAAMVVAVFVVSVAAAVMFRRRPD